MQPYFLLHFNYRLLDKKIKHRYTYKCVTFNQPLNTVLKLNTDTTLSHTLTAETLETTDRTKLFPNKVLTMPRIWLIH